MWIIGAGWTLQFMVTFCCTRNLCWNDHPRNTVCYVYTHILQYILLISYRSCGANNTHPWLPPPLAPSTPGSLHLSLTPRPRRHLSRDRAHWHCLSRPVSDWNIYAYCVNHAWKAGVLFSSTVTVFPDRHSLGVTVWKNRHSQGVTVWKNRHSQGGTVWIYCHCW